MNNSPKDNENSGTSKKGGNVISALLKVIGSILILLVIISSLPLSVPKLFKLKTYNVVSGSMAPEIPVGSLIYVKETPPEELIKDDIILFAAGNSQVVHRVVENNLEEHTFTTKGDANNAEDMGQTLYNMVEGKVVFHLPVLGNLLQLYSSKQGKMAVLSVAFLGALLSLIANRIPSRK